MGSTKVQVITFRARLATVGQYADDVEKKDRAARATTTFTTSIVGRAKGCYDLKWCRTEFTRLFFFVLNFFFVIIRNVNLIHYE